MCRNLCKDLVRSLIFELQNIVSLEEYTEKEQSKANDGILKSIYDAQARASKSRRPDALVETEEFFSKVVSQQSLVVQGVLKDLRTGMGYEEIAEKQGIPAGTVGSHISRSREILKAAMSE
jgi:DNA-directed RNA polymerase specialized sigma24 family protein